MFRNKSRIFIFHESILILIEFKIAPPTLKKLYLQILTAS